MLNSIHTLLDVEVFFSYLINEESLNFHPDEDFHNYINLETGFPSYSLVKAQLRNQLMFSSFEVCEKENGDIYSIGIELLFNKLKH
jgi:hypothetical protein